MKQSQNMKMTEMSKEIINCFTCMDFDLYELNLQEENLYHLNYEIFLFLMY